MESWVSWRDDVEDIFVPRVKNTTSKARNAKILGQRTTGQKEGLLKGDANNNDNNLFICSALFNMLGDQKRMLRT